jgi:hypothetical protein
MAKKMDEKLFDEALNVNIEMRAVDLCILGKSPLIMNRLSEKARQELLLPSLKKNRTERATTLKHMPVEEFNRSMYRVREDDGPTRLVLPSGMFKKCTASVALRLPGSNKTEMGQLVRIICEPDSRGPGVNVPIYGLPMMFMAPVRQLGINRTPDIRTRAILPKWACYLKVGYVYPLLKEATVIKHVSAAGWCMGIGDWRSEKGAGDFGSFELVAADDPEFLDIINSGGRQAQDEAIGLRSAYNIETEELLEWFDDELIRRDERQSTNGKPAAVIAGDIDDEEGESDDFEQ